MSMPHPRQVMAVIKSMKNWPQVVLDKLQINPSKESIYKFKNGLQFHARSNSTDGLVLAEVISNKTYTHMPGFKINKGDVVVDIGANIGAFTVLAAKKARRVYAYEPETESYARLMKNLKLNNVTNVTARQTMVGGKTTVTDLHLNVRAGDHSIYRRPREIGKQHGSMITFDKLVKDNNLKRIDFLKMDCEGAEFDILLNAPKSALRKVDRIALEFHEEFTGRKRQEIASHLRKNGFEVQVMNHETTAQLGMIFARRKPRI